MATEYESKPHRMTVAVWPNDTADEITRLIGAENVNLLANGSGIQARNGDGEWVTLGEGWAVGMSSTGVRRIMSPGALNDDYQLPASAPAGA
jgi:hypothetical protein